MFNIFIKVLKLLISSYTVALRTITRRGTGTPPFPSRMKNFFTGCYLRKRKWVPLIIAFRTGPAPLQSFHFLLYWYHRWWNRGGGRGGPGLWGALIYAFISTMLPLHECMYLKLNWPTIEIKTQERA